MRTDRIQQLLHVQNMTYAELAEKTGLHTAVVHRYCTGVTKGIPADRVALLAKALGTTPAFILGVDDEDPIGEDERTLLSKYKSLSDENKALMDGLLERLLESQK